MPVAPCQVFYQEMLETGQIIDLSPPLNDLLLLLGIFHSDY